MVWQNKGPVVSLRGLKNTHFVKSGERELQFTIKLPLASQEIFKKGAITYFPRSLAHQRSLQFRLRPHKAVI